MACFRHPNEMRFGVYALCPTFADEKRKAELPEKEIRTERDNMGKTGIRRLC